MSTAILLPALNRVNADFYWTWPKKFRHSTLADEPDFFVCITQGMDRSVAEDNEVLLKEPIEAVSDALEKLDE